MITTNPQSVSVAPGSNVVLSVTASGATSYQWRFNGADISGATNAALTVTHAQFNNTGYYVVLAKNSIGWVPSQLAYLSVVDTWGIVPLRNSFYSNAIANYQDSFYYSGGPITNGTARLLAGPTLDQMQDVPQWQFFCGGAASYLGEFFKGRRLFAATLR